MPTRPIIRKQTLVNKSFDEEMMRLAITLAKKGEGLVEPNPMVGCVIAQHNQIIGQGYHRRFGGPHAEINALRSCKKKTKGATMYVTLEPCNHRGKTPPCSDALIHAGIARVVVANRDPHDIVKNKGIRQLRKEGVQVDVGILAKESTEILAPYLIHIKHHRPYVIVKWAQSLDGKLATNAGQSKWISCETSRKKVHRLRARMDGVLVGIETVLKDNPKLTARDVPIKRTASRIVLDTRLRIPENCQLVKTARKTPTIVFTTLKYTNSRKADRLRKRGVDIVTTRSRHNLLIIGDVLKKLSQLEMTNVMVEGGAAILSSFLKLNLIDEAWVFTAPKVINGKSHHVVKVNRIAGNVIESLNPVRTKIKKSGSDTFHRMWFSNP